MTTPHRPITPKDVVDYRAPRDAQISPDGQFVAFSLEHASKPRPMSQLPSQIWLAEVASAHSRRLTFSAGVDCSPRWSPDSRRLAFLSDRARSDQFQLHVLELSGGEARPVTQLQGAVSDPAWSPDGQLIGFLVTESPPAADSDVFVADSPQHYRRVWLVDPQTGSPFPLTPDGFQVHEWKWSPDGTHIAIIAKEGDSTPSGWYTAQIYVLPVAQPHNIRQLFTSQRQICALEWSPDSAQIAFLASFISDQPLWSGDVCIVGVQGGAPRVVTPPYTPMSFTRLDWRTPETIIYSARQLDGTSFGQLNVTTGAFEPLWSAYAMIGDWTVPRISLAADHNTFAAVLENPETPPQVYAGRLDAVQNWQQVSHFDYAPLQMGRMEPTRWRAHDGLEIVGHIVYPVGYQAGKRYPTFVQIHGGPAWSWLPHYAVWWEWWYQYLAGRGYLVLLPNIRGSTGRGTAYTEANWGDVCGSDWQDVLDGVDHLIALGLADPDRLGIGGWSYGGVMTAWAVSQSTRFKAAVMGAGITNWESYYAQNGIRDWQRILFGSTPYDNPAYHRSISALTHIKRAVTPTLILHGQEDMDVPVAQAYEMYVALKTIGVETQLITYPREHHPIQERDHQLDLLARIADWCDRYLKL